MRTVLAEDFDIVGSVTMAVMLWPKCTRLDPDVLVIDISMPIVDGLQAASQVQPENCRTKIVFLTVHEDQDFVAAALFLGASGYVTKSHLSSDLATAIREALQGRTLSRS